MKNNFIKLIGIIAAIVIAVVVVIILVSSSSRKQAEDEVQKGIEYIKTREAMDPNEVEKKIFEGKREIMIKEITDQIDADPDYVWKALADINTVITGDSRAAGFRVYELLDESKVIASEGHIMEDIIDYDKIRAANPNLIVMVFGLNDLGAPHSTPEEFAAAACEIVDNIHAFLPDCYIYIQSILPPSPSGSTTIFTYDLVTEWSDAEIKYYKDHGYRYLDINYLLEEHPEMYEPDGFHVNYNFYQLWAEAILKQYINDSVGVEGPVPTAGTAESTEESAVEGETTAEEESAEEETTE